MTLQQQAVQTIKVLPESKLPTLIQFARFLNNSPEAVETTKMADDFNETPAEFKEYI